ARPDWRRLRRQSFRRPGRRSPGPAPARAAAAGPSGRAGTQRPGRAAPDPAAAPARSGAASTPADAPAREKVRAAVLLTAPPEVTAPGATAPRRAGTGRARAATCGTAGGRRPGAGPPTSRPGCGRREPDAPPRERPDSRPPPAGP